MTKIITGKKGERLAADFLTGNGYQILETNFRCPLGEIDIIARDHQEIVFVEVKTRKSHALGYPEQAVGIQKQKKLSQLALWYLQAKKMSDKKARFDVVAVTLAVQANEINLIKNAFDFVDACP
ncbi:MAG TPA: YraN family protein [Smithella sp.]|jgi:putative endonuclease|nr:YraN family protein [Smithella sp.]HOG10807.1 YraN family protein [Smithella sp.]HOS13826.1 YraN family protein [Smithella sp.]HOX98459.1 YraN family protein [Smithella sp.]HPL46609.1 YraN family protein [Smithella sp.]